ncbi:hypothetical protein NCTGTJJY_CDS0240 [Serratia phage 92A1]|nr:hypothetical protein NCTGTJJY_CDS0240 [Serratia phage 92A1]
MQLSEIVITASKIVAEKRIAPYYMGETRYNEIDIEVLITCDMQQALYALTDLAYDFDVIVHVGPHVGWTAITVNASLGTDALFTTSVYTTVTDDGFYSHKAVKE